MGYLHVWSLSINSMTLQKNMGMLHIKEPSDFFQLENGYKISSESIFHKVVVLEFLDGHPQKGGKVITTFKKFTPYIGNQLISQMRSWFVHSWCYMMCWFFSIFKKSSKCGVDFLGISCKFRVNGSWNIRAFEGLFFRTIGAAIEKSWPVTSLQCLFRCTGVERFLWFLVGCGYHIFVDSCCHI